MLASVLFIAFLFDLLLGDPVYRLHPVRLIGLLIGSIEKMLRRVRLAGVFGGAVLMVSVSVCVLAVYAALFVLLNWLCPTLTVVMSVYVVYSCIALRDMVKHATPIKIALWQSDIVVARSCLAKIVGRDVSVLDEAAVARATVESVSESFVDGFFAPIFWFVVAGVVAGLAGLQPLPFAVAAVLAYRCVNTLDSMVGYKNERYLLFGRVSALTDDVLNFLPARVALLVMGVGASVLGMNPVAGWKVAMRDRLKHASPNSAHTESFVAGVLGLRLGGPTVYSHGTVDKPWLGDGIENVLPKHISDVCRLVLASAVVSVLIGAVIMVVSI